MEIEKRTRKAISEKYVVRNDKLRGCSFSICAPTPLININRQDGIITYLKAKKRGAVWLPFAFQNKQLLELIAPGDAHIHPVAALARNSVSVLSATKVLLYVVDITVSSCSKIGSIIPEHGSPDAHPVHQKIPDVPFAEENPVTFELSASNTTSSGPAGKIGPLKVRAEQNGPRFARRPCKKSLGTPDKQIMADQEHIGLWTGAIGPGPV